jgi:cyclopropane-fatty-acyl-phospholipid synthase
VSVGGDGRRLVEREVTMLFARFLAGIIATGDLTIIDARGRHHRFGDGGPPHVAVRLADPGLHWKLFLRPELHAGEAYTEGSLAMQAGSIYDFLALVAANAEAAGRAPTQGWSRRIDRLRRLLARRNLPARARRNARHHYDLSGRLYGLFLDADRQYSCAYFLDPADDLETAQRRKLRHIAAKLAIRPGMRVLDIGCGWGGMALYLAERLGARVTGITLSAEQLRVAEDRVRAAGLADRITLALRDYREETGTYDRIVSVGMFEHVGAAHFDAFFAQVRDRLADDGVALIHTIGHADVPGPTNPWIRRHIFPGGHIPSLSEMAAAIERSQLWMTDVEIWRLHYAMTLGAWRQRFLARRGEVEALYDARFCRMWEFYLAAAEVAFRHLRQCVFQVQVARRRDALPIVRDYMVDDERRLARADSCRWRAA